MDDSPYITLEEIAELHAEETNASAPLPKTPQSKKGTSKKTGRGRGAQTPERGTSESPVPSRAAAAASLATIDAQTPIIFEGLPVQPVLLPFIEHHSVPPDKMPSENSDELPAVIRRIIARNQYFMHRIKTKSTGPPPELTAVLHDEPDGTTHDDTMEVDNTVIKEETATETPMMIEPTQELPGSLKEESTLEDAATLISQALEETALKVETPAAATAEVEVDDGGPPVIEDDGLIVELDNELAAHLLKQSVAVELALFGYESASSHALDVLTSVVAAFIERIGFLARSFMDVHGAKLDIVEIMHKAIGEIIPAGIQALREWLSNDLLRFNNRLRNVEPSQVDRFINLGRRDEPQEIDPTQFYREQFLQGAPFVRKAPEPKVPLPFFQPPPSSAPQQPPPNFPSQPISHSMMPSHAPPVSSMHNPPTTVVGGAPPSSQYGGYHGQAPNQIGPRTINPQAAHHDGSVHNNLPPGGAPMHGMPDTPRGPGRPRKRPPDQLMEQHRGPGRPPKTVPMMQTPGQPMPASPHHPTQPIMAPPHSPHNIPPPPHHTMQPPMPAPPPPHQMMPHGSQSMMPHSSQSMMPQHQPMSPTPTLRMAPQPQVGQPVNMPQPNTPIQQPMGAAVPQSPAGEYSDNDADYVDDSYRRAANKRKRDDADEDGIRSRRTRARRSVGGSDDYYYDDDDIDDYDDDEARRKRKKSTPGRGKSRGKTN